MKYFFDTEFQDNGKNGQVLLSIGVVAADGREYYAVNSEADLEKSNDWVKKNVHPYLGGPLKTRNEIAMDLLAFFKANKPFERELPELWAYFSAYDFMVYSYLFGFMIDIPAGMPYHCMDLMQLMRHLGLSKHDLPPLEGTQHNALDDARWVKNGVLFCYEYAKEKGIAIK